MSCSERRVGSWIRKLKTIFNLVFKLEIMRLFLIKSTNSTDKVQELQEELMRLQVGCLFSLLYVKILIDFNAQKYFCDITSV